MAQNGTVTYVLKLPPCDFPHTKPANAQYDFRTTDGRWGNGCLRHWQLHRMYTTLGTGKGQRLEVRS